MNPAIIEENHHKRGRILVVDDESSARPRP